MRSKKAALYAIFDSSNQIIRSILSIYVRRTFIMTLGDSLMGLNGLFSSVLSFLSLAELGFGSVVAVCLYQSIAEDNKKVICAYMNMLKKIYWFMGVFILTGGIVIFPAVQKMINGEYNQAVVLGGYLLHLLGTAVSYFCSYRGTLLYANQEGYVASRTNLITYTACLIAQILVLVWRKSYYGFLVCTVLQNLIGGIWLTRYVNRKYSYLLESGNNVDLPTDEKRKFFNKFKAMLVYKISDYLIQGADNMIISVAIGTIVVGYYSNYNLIVNMCWAIFGSVAIGSVAGIGNMIYTEQEKLSETLFRLLMLQQFIFGVSATGIFQLSSIFVTTFLSSESMLPVSFVAVLTMYYYIRGIIHPLETVRMGAGAYEKDKWMQLGIAVLNVVISIIGCMMWGIQGVVLGTFICYFVRGLYLTPKQIFGSIIGRQYKKTYFEKLLLYVLVTVVINFVLYFCLEKIHIENAIFEFIIKGFICVCISVVVNILLFGRTKEFTYLKELCKNNFLK